MEDRSRRCPPGILDEQHRGAALAVGPHRNLARGPVAVHGIGEQVGDKLAEPIGVDEGRGRRQVAPDLDGARGGERADAVDRGARVLREVHGAGCAGRLAGVEARQDEQRLDDAPHLLRGVQAGGGGLAILRGALRPRASVACTSAIITLSDVRNSWDASAVNRRSCRVRTCLARQRPGADTAERSCLANRGRVGDIERYRPYLQQTRGEFTVVKHQNTGPRCGWFSDRTASYLAANRSVITQDAAFDKYLPTGPGLFTFLTIHDVLAAVDAIASAYAGDWAAAREIAEEYFAAKPVVGKMMQQAEI